MTKLKPTVNWKKYFNTTSPNVEYYKTPNGFKFLEQSFLKIKRGIQYNRPQITLIKFHNSKITSTIKREEYSRALQMILKLCIKLEYYEICSDIQKYCNIKKSKTKKEVTI